VTLREHAKDFIARAKQHHRSWTKDDSRLSRVLPVLGDKLWDEITTGDVERFLGLLMEGNDAVAPATRNRYRDLLSGLFKRAHRLGLVSANPVKGIPKLKEPAGRVVYLTIVEEQALRDALPTELHPLVTVALHTGFALERAGTVAVARRGHAHRHDHGCAVEDGRTRHIPMNAVVRSVLYDTGAKRRRPDDPSELVFTAVYRTTARTFECAARAAQAQLASAGKDGSHLAGGVDPVQWTVNCFRNCSPQGL